MSLISQVDDLHLKLSQLWGDVKNMRLVYEARITELEAQVTDLELKLLTERGAVKEST